jgi:hypothetical protein
MKGSLGVSCLLLVGLCTFDLKVTQPFAYIFPTCLSDPVLIWWWLWGFSTPNDYKIYKTLHPLQQSLKVQHFSQ